MTRVRALLGSAGSVLVFVSLLLGLVVNAGMVALLVDQGDGSPAQLGVLALSVLLTVGPGFAVWLALFGRPRRRAEL